MPAEKRTRKRGSGPAFTLELPRPLEARRDGDAWWFEVDGRELRLSNLNKLFWPDEGYTKGDMVAYYLNVAELILPYLAQRPLTMKRMPDGVNGGFFYEKTAPSHTPDWIDRCSVRSDDSKRGVIDYLVVNDAASLLYVVNLGCVEFHPLHSRCDDVAHPDYLFFDLDPFPPYTYEDVLTVARHIKVLLDQLGLTAFPKTSGATGMQIFMPLERGRYTYELVRAFVGACGRLITRADPERATMAWKIPERAGKVFIDHNMNRSGANIAAVYSLRPEARAPVSTPLTWDEVMEGGFEPGDFRIDNVWERFARVGDLFDGVRNQAMDLSNALEALDVQEDDADQPPKRLPKTAAPATRRRTSEEVIAASKDPKLAEYVRKRDFEGTPEPAPADAADKGVVEADTGNSFVIHKHRATRLHYDVRLERDGALPSWAVPKGLPTAKGDKRLAVRTEDHPLEYGKFEGTIPAGHYGAGEVRIFDDGWYEPVEWTDSKVSFRLHGRRYPGLEFHFVKTRTDWLAFLASHQEAPTIAAPPRFQPMLAEAGHEAFDDPDWWFEPKLDGIRCLAELSTGATVLRTRTGRDATAQYKELHMIHELVDQVNAVLDGEIVAFDPDGKNSFEALQQRMNLTGEREIATDRQADPCFSGGLRPAMAGRTRDDRTEAGRAPRAAALDRRAGSSAPADDPRRGRGSGVHPGRAEARPRRRRGEEARLQVHAWAQSRHVAKDKAGLETGLAILGWTPGQGGRAGTFGALLVGVIDGGGWKWIGQVGSGFTDNALKTLLESLEPFRRDAPPIDDPDLASLKGVTYVELELVCQVEYLEVTKSTGKMRAPVFKGMRPDKTPDECVLEPPARA